MVSLSNEIAAPSHSPHTMKTKNYTRLLHGQICRVHKAPHSGPTFIKIGRGMVHSPEGSPLPRMASPGELRALNNLYLKPAVRNIIQSKA